MANRTLAVLLVLAVASMATATLLGGLDHLAPEEEKEAKGLVQAFEKINRYLELSGAKKIELMMRDIRDIYQRKKINLLDKLKSDPEKSLSRLRRALKLFLALPKAVKMCNYEGYKILAQNHLALKADANPASSRSSKISREYSLRHAEFCRGKYTTELQKLDQKNLEGEASKKFATAKQIIEGLKSSDCLQLSNVYAGKAGDFLNTSPICIKHLMRQLLIVHKQTTGSSVSGRFELVWSALTGSMQAHLIDPCRDHYEQYKTVFAPAIYDANFERIVGTVEEVPLSAGLRDFRACESIIKRNKSLQRLMALEIPQK